MIELRVEKIKLEAMPQQGRRWAQKDCEEGEGVRQAQAMARTPVRNVHGSSHQKFKR